MAADASRSNGNQGHLNGTRAPPDCPVLPRFAPTLPPPVLGRFPEGYWPGKPRFRRPRRSQLLVGHFLVGSPFRKGPYWTVRVQDLATGDYWKMSTGEKDLDKAKKAIKVMLVEPIHRSPEGSKVRVDADMVLWEGELPSGGVVPGMLPAVQQAPSRPVMPWQDAFERFVGSLTCSRKRAEEIRGSKKIYAEHFSDKATDAITPADVEGIKVGLHKKGRKAKTIREHIQVLRQFFRWCEVHGLVDSNPATKITPPHGEAREGIPFTHEEAVKLLQACREPHVFNAPRGGRRSRIPPDWLHLSIFIGLRTGLRRANILGMCWHQIDLDARRISFEAKDMKMRRRHEVPIHIELLEVLHDMQARLNPKPEDRLIPREGHTVYNRWIGLIARAGLKGRRIHDMRHTVETWLAQNGVEPTLRDAILGHVKGGGSMTARYTHWQWEDLVAAMDKMPRLLP